MSFLWDPVSWRFSSIAHIAGDSKGFLHFWGFGGEFAFVSFHTGLKEDILEVEVGREQARPMAQRVRIKKMEFKCEIILKRGWQRRCEKVFSHLFFGSNLYIYIVNFLILSIPITDTSRKRQTFYKVMIYRHVTENTSVCIYQYYSYTAKNTMSF